MNGIRRFAAVALGVLGAACRPAPPAGPALVVTHDLARRAFAADASGPWQHMVFGTPPAARFEVDGFVLPNARTGPARFLWGRQDVVVRVGGEPGAARRVVLDLEPHPLARRLRLDPYYNDDRLPTLSIPHGRHRVLLDLPATPPGKSGENELRLFFRGVSRNTIGLGGRVAAALYTLTAGPPDDAGLAALADDATAAPLGVESTKGVPALVQGRGTLRYAVRLSAGAELHFVPSLASSPASGGATLRVLLESGGSEREVWSASLPGASREVRVPLPATGLAAVSLRVEGPSAVRARWTAPRLLGTEAEDLFAERESGSEAVETLRRSLAGLNVLLVIFDAGGAKHFGPYGYSRRTTPELDRIAAEGVVFERAYTPAVYTLPAMSSAFTALEPDEHGSVDLHHGRLPSALTLAEVLSAHGIRTAGFVANGVVGRLRGFNRGFADFFEMYHSAYDATEAGRFRGVLHPWLEANKDKRFFAWVHVREPHFPYDPPAPFDTAFGPDGPIPKPLRSEIELVLAVDNRRRTLLPVELEHLVRLYDGNLAYADSELGALRRKLEEIGLLEKTVLIVAADHGESLFEHGHIGHEVQVYDELTHIPLVMRFPKGRGPAGTRVRELVSLTDMAPTIADAFGLWKDPKTRPPFHAVSLLPVAVGGPGLNAVVSRDRGMQPRYAIREADAKAIVNTATGKTELYDLGADPGETRDLAAAEPLRAAFYRQALFGWVLEREPEGVSEPIALTPEQQENMKALGYIQ